MRAIDIPTKFPIPFANAPATGTSRAVPVTGSGADGSANLTLGFPPINGQPVAVGGIPPFQQDFNGLLNQITAWTRWATAGAPTLFDATFQTAIGGYPTGAIVGSASTLGLQFLSIVDNNTTNPDAGGAGWRPFTVTAATPARLLLFGAI